jgi:hypothetical protein
MKWMVAIVVTIGVTGLCRAAEFGADQRPAAAAPLLRTTASTATGHWVIQPEGKSAHWVGPQPAPRVLSLRASPAPVRQWANADVSFVTRDLTSVMPYMSVAAQIPLEDVIRKVRQAANWTDSAPSTLVLSATMKAPEYASQVAASAAPTAPAPTSNSKPVHTVTIRADQSAASPTPRPNPTTAPESQLAASAERRVALVIGNSQYRSAAFLPNPRRDAKTVADALRQTGFQSVELAMGLDRDAMLKTLRAFRDQADKADWALIYFAGHRIEIGRVNYLVPVDAKLLDDRDVKAETVSYEELLGAAGGPRTLRCPADERKERRPGQNEMTRRWLSIKLLMRSSAEANPVLDSVFDPRASRRGGAGCRLPNWQQKGGTGHALQSSLQGRG